MAKERDYESDYVGRLAYVLMLIVVQLTDLIPDLHSLNIVHTDLKPDNIAIVDDSMVPLSHIGNNGEHLTLVTVFPDGLNPLTDILLERPY